MTGGELRAGSGGPWLGAGIRQSREACLAWPEGKELEWTVGVLGVTARLLRALGYCLYAGEGEDADGAGLDPPAVSLAGGGGDRGILPRQRVKLRVHARLVAQYRDQVMRVLVLGDPAGVLPGGLHGIRCDDDTLQGQRLQQRLE